MATRKPRAPGADDLADLVLLLGELRAEATWHWGVAQSPHLPANARDDHARRAHTNRDHANALRRVLLAHGVTDLPTELVLS